MPQPADKRLVTEAAQSTQISPLKSRLNMLDSAGQRGYTVDQNVGRVVKVWDYLNNREQMIYGDTGWRKINLELGWSGTTYIRRIGGNARILFDGVSTSTATGGSVLILPSGFRAGAPSSVSERFLLHNTSSAVRRGFISISAVTLANYSAGEAMYGSADFPTNDPWPTSLPGVAV